MDTNDRTNNRIRTALATDLGRCLAVLVAYDDREALGEVLAVAGYSSVSNLHTCEDIGNGIATLTALLNLDDLAAVVHTASFRVAILNGDWESADRTAMTTLAECDRSGRVLRRFLDRVNTERRAA